MYSSLISPISRCLHNLIRTNHKHHVSQDLHNFPLSSAFTHHKYSPLQFLIME
nr:MAG TPA: hypothetical protein [Caudoviricetes sp.]